MALTRRSWMLGAAAAVLPAAGRQRLLAQVYIFVQDAQRRKTRAVEEVDRICATFAAAGFRDVELMQDFFEPGVREATIAALGKHGLRAPIVYAGGAMHEAEAAARTREKVIAIAEAARDAGIEAINTNPNPKPGKQSKTAAELDVQARSLDLLGAMLARRGMRLLYHAHDPEMAEDAREWRYMLHHTDPRRVWFCIDTHWIYRGGQDPVRLLLEAGKRTASLHVRNSRGKVWSETFGPGDVDYTAIAGALRRAGVSPSIVVELAYEEGTEADWDLRTALKQSGDYARQVFGL